MEQLESLGMEKDRGLQVLSPRSKAVTFDMESLSLEPSHSFPFIKERKNALQLRLQQRRTREQLVDLGIMPPLKTPAAFHDQIRSLERARTETFLKHKICSRPERAELVRMHILQETQAEPSLQARQMKLKRARLADDLNEKIAQRPGPMELVEKNILPVDCSVKEASTGEVNYQKTLDVYRFDEESSDALSSEDPASQESQCSVPSPREAKLPEFSSATPTAGSNVQHCPPTSRSLAFHEVSDKGQANPQATTPAQTVNTIPAIRSGPTLVKQSHSKLPSERNRNKKSKEIKPRVKKLKYHQYIPPDQKQEPNEAPMDSTYARLLQQQQQFLHLQILSQQQQHFSYQAILPTTVSKAVPETQGSCPNVAMGSSQGPIVLSLSCSTPGHVNTTSFRKPGPLPANLEEMKVAELKMELKFRGLPVSGTKTDLIERLKPYQERSKSSSTQPSVTKNTISSPANPQSETINTTPPASPVHVVVSSPTVDETGESKAAVTMSPSFSIAEDPPSEAAVCDKDQRLHEKERQIEELMRKLEQEQRLVEELKMQLEVEKRNQQGAQHEQTNLDPPAHIKVECDASSCCSTSMNQEECVAPQGVQAPQTILRTQSGQHILLSTTIHLPQTQQVLQTTVSSSAQSNIQTPLLQPMKTETTFQQNQTQAGPQPLSPCHPTYVLPHSPFNNHHSPKSKDPPRYEEAVKQTRALQSTMQVSTAISQHMDDLFDILIESGEISPLIQQHHLSEDKPLPVTASVTTLPVNTALSRPPPQIQVAHMPSPVALASDHQLEALLEDTLAPVTEHHSICMVEDLLLEPGHSLVDTSEPNSCDSPSTSLHLHETNLDNMEWLELTVPGPVGISTPACVFSSGFIDSHALHWD